MILFPSVGGKCLIDYKQLNHNACLEDPEDWADHHLKKKTSKLFKMRAIDAGSNVSPACGSQVSVGGSYLPSFHRMASLCSCVPLIKKTKARTRHEDFIRGLRILHLSRHLPIVYCAPMSAISFINYIWQSWT